MDSYEAAWRQYRKWRVWWVALQVGGFLVMLTLYELALGRIAIAWAKAIPVALLALIIAGVRLGDWPCPACGKHFFGPWWWHSQFARRCFYCGLPKWAAGR